ncbi:hypothetical protein MMC17_003257 [Xylographa soralifera]|nr:hypothetical protein [Xylographa soralifera]
MEAEIDEEIIIHEAFPNSEDSQDGNQLALDEAQSKAQNSSAEAIKLQNNLKARKRTKTGCLTCRKRRIKCGEERPTCANCIKSKRSCEGYAPRLTFKDPLGAFRPGWAVKGHGAHYQSFSSPNGVTGHYARPLSTPGAQSQLPAIAPRPLPLEHTNEDYLPNNVSISPWSAGSQSSTQNGLLTPIEPSQDLPPRMRSMYERQSNQQSTSSQHEQTTETLGIQNISAATFLPTEYSTQNAVQRTEHLEPRNLPLVPVWPSSGESSGISNDNLQAPAPVADQASTSATPQSLYVHTQDSQQNQDAREYNEYENERSFSQPAQLLDQKSALQQAHNYIPIGQSFPDLTNYDWSVNNGAQSHINSHYVHHIQTPSTPSFHAKRDVLEKPRQPLLQYPNTNDDPDDDLFDVESDDEGVAIISRIASTPQNDVGLMLALAASQDDRVLRSYTTFLDAPNVLSSYQPTFTASPLMDSTTARVFCHFITATGPSLSIFERHPTNPSVMFTGAPVPTSQQSLWTYTLPMKALSNQALLHAMLALASLHIASLQKTPQTASLRHYHFALRRLTKALSIPSKRTDIATIAATLILGHYEATSAEHSKWNKHLAGARQLLMEVDFKGMTKHIREKKALQEAQNTLATWHSPTSATADYNSFHRSFDSPPEDTVDENIVGKLMGWKIRYDEYGRILDDNVEYQTSHITEKDIENHKILSDLFWWYAKQDVYQSVISGNRLLLPYDRWGHCPPRAPIGKLEAIYGTMDHVVLLMGRIADFASKDQARKRKVMEANGGQWRPSPGMLPNSPTSTQQPGEQQSQSSSPRQAPPPSSQPPMYGMIPNIPPPQTPERFTQAPRDQIYIPHNKDDDFELEEATIEAGNEWREIQNALDLFERSLGTEWRSLPDYLAPPFETAFGTALQYRTWSISCIWTMFYTGRIIAARVHPSMPPAAMMAAGVAASQTAQWANEIGRICCGLQFPPPEQPLNPALGAALMESTLSVFFAGVQYTDPLQRSTIISRLVTIAEMTGQQSSALIAAGIEQCWKIGGDAGRGPPYTPVVAKNNKKSRDHRMSGIPAPRGEELDRQMVYVHPGTRVHYAMGIMSLEEDFRDLRLVKRTG